MVIFFIFFKIKVCCVYSLESPHRGDSYEYTQHTFKVKEETYNYPKYIYICSYWKKILGTDKNKFEIAVVNEPSVFEPSNFQCILNFQKDVEDSMIFFPSKVLTKISMKYY